MEHRRLGKSGLQVSVLGLGTMTFGNQVVAETALSMMDMAFDAGISLFDCADIYPLGGKSGQAGTTEEIVGKWISTKRRDEIVVTTKCFAAMGTGANQKGLSRGHILTAVEDSLRRLKTDYIDIYMAHAFDENVPLEEVARAFEDLVRQGKVRYIGVSNWDAWQMMKLCGLFEKDGFCPLVCDELRYNLLFRRSEDEIVPFCQSEGLGLIAYNPLAGGLLTGKYQFEEMPQGNERFNPKIGGELYQKRYWNQAVFRAVESYLGICKQWGTDPVSTAVRWTMGREGINSVLIGASRKEQLSGTLAAISMPPLCQEQLAQLDEIWYQVPRNSGEMPH